MVGFYEWFCSRRFCVLRFSICIFFLIATLFLSLSCGSDSDEAPRQTPQAVDGVLDLRDWDFKNHGNVRLEGQWEFHWQKFLPPNSPPTSEFSPTVEMIKTPSFWNGHKTDGEELSGDGYATYRLRVLRGEPNRMHSIYFKNILMAYKCFINGQEITEVGQVGRTSETTRPQTYTHIVELETRDEELDIILWVSNFNHTKGGMFETPILGLSSQIREQRERQIALALFLFGSLLIMALYHFGLYAIRSQHISPVYFGLFALSIAGKIPVSNEHFLTQMYPDLNWEIVIKLTMITTYLSPVFFALFLKSVLPKECPRIFVLTYTFSGAILALITVVFPARIFMHFVMPFQLLIVVACVVVSYIIILGTIRKRKGSRAILTGWILLFASVLNDILHDNCVIRTGYFASAGLFAFIFSQAFVLALRFSEAFSRAEKLSADLDNKSKELEEANIQLVHFNVELERRVQERTQELEQAHQQLFQTAHQAGMAEISANIIHSIGNILNTVNCKIQAVIGNLKESRVSKLKTISEVIEKNKGNLSEYFSGSRGEEFPRYLVLATQEIEKNHDLISQESHEIVGLVGQINEVIISQQEYALSERQSENIDLKKTAHDVALFFQEDLHPNTDISFETSVISEAGVDLMISGQRTKITFALTEIIKNAIDSLRESQQSEKQITLTLGFEPLEAALPLFVKIQDNGIGIVESDLELLFNFGFTTKKDGRGFSLHTCANYIKEMRGTISVDSPGSGQGATFTLRFPAPKKATKTSLMPE